MTDTNMTEHSISTILEKETIRSKDTDMHTLTPPRTPTSTSTSAHKLYAEIQDIYTALCKLETLAPGPQINELLTRLVKLCIAPYSTQFVTNFFSIHGVQNLCEELRPICAAAEGYLESHWAQRILQAAQSPQRTRTHHPNPIGLKEI
jgi:nicotianamine synthase